MAKMTNDQKRKLKKKRASKIKQAQIDSRHSRLFPADKLSNEPVTKPRRITIRDGEMWTGHIDKKVNAEGGFDQVCSLFQPIAAVKPEDDAIFRAGDWYVFAGDTHDGPIKDRETAFSLAHEKHGALIYRDDNGNCAGDYPDYTVLQSVTTGDFNSFKTTITELYQEFGQDFDPTEAFSELEEFYFKQHQNNADFVSIMQDDDRRMGDVIELLFTHELDDEATRLEYLMQFYYEGYPAEDTTA
jgi:hypothetical protein